MLRAELGFYLGCVNLRNKLARRDMPVCFPVAHPSGERWLRFCGLYDASLALRLEQPPVSNDANANGKDLVVVTGANQGGKSTFLRGVGIAQILMQAGVFVSATELEALLEHRVKVFLVTHLYSLARGLFEETSFAALFLRAGRREDGVRTFRLIEAGPLQTSFGQDLYRQIFGVDQAPGKDTPQ